MRHYLKSVLITIATFYIATSFINTINFGNDPKNVLMFLAGLWIISQIVNPIFSLVLLPVNILTFGLISFLLNVAFVFALLTFLPGFAVSAFYFKGAVVHGVIFPAVPLNQIETVVALSALITILHKILHIIFE
jgi:uncharacterized membrane protein YvlD (DUF360 family)